MRICFPPPGRMHSPSSPPRVAAREAVQSRQTTGSRIIVARLGLIVVCPALESGPPSLQISAPKSRTAAFSCDASRTRFHRGSHSSGEKKKKQTSPSKPVGTHLRVISKHYNNSTKNDILIFRCRIKLFPAQKCASAEYCDGSYPRRENDMLRSIK